MTMPYKEMLALVVERTRSAIGTNRIADALDIFLGLHLADQAEIFNLLKAEEQDILLKHLDIPSTADLFDELEDDETLEASESLSLERLADVLDEMEPDEAADLLGDLPPEQASEALAQMDEPEDVLPLLGYPDETAGGRMTTEFLGLDRQTTCEEAIHILRAAKIEGEAPYYLFVVDQSRHLNGVIGLRELVISKPGATMESIMNSDVLHVAASADQEEAARVMAHYDLSALPVVDENHRMVGIITHDDIVDVLEEEATEDIYLLANVTDADLEPESPIREHLIGRLPWLYLNTVTALFAAWVISNFESLFAQVAVLAVFQSVVAGQGGNAAAQNVAMIVRSLALGKMTTRKFWSVLRRQIMVGLLQGLAIGTVVGIGVALWRGNIYLGLILGLALLGNMVVAGIAGTFVPLGLQAIGQDPALASSVLVTAATDSLGFLIFLSLASYFLPYLQN